MMDNQDQIRKIIKYDPRREYIGEWTPQKLHSTFYEIHQNPFRPLVFMWTGKLSNENICDALWNEMSYNPVRFGTQNLFEFNDILSIRNFYNTQVKIAKTDDIMHKITSEIGYFLYFIGKSNPEFIKHNEIFSHSVLIKCDNNRKSNYGYKALSCLVHSIHLIASQNLKDYGRKDFRIKIQEAVIARHPNMKRPNQYVNFIGIERTKKQQDNLYSAIMKKNFEIMETSTHINTLGEYEPPVDTSRERALLLRQTIDLQNLEEKYEAMKNKYDQMVQVQKIYE